MRGAIARAFGACARTRSIALLALAIASAATPASADKPPIRDPHLRIVPGNTTMIGPGPDFWTYAIEVEDGIPIDRERFAATVDRILFDKRGWAGPRSHIALQRVDEPPYDFRITLARPATVNRLCYPLGTVGRVSCENRGRSVINWLRWSAGSPAWSSRARYREYLINHEVGHSLGHKHRFCPGRGRTAPVMQQQTGSASPCRHGWWPQPFEIRQTDGPSAKPAPDSR
jgi:hypothetical protein